MKGNEGYMPMNQQCNNKNTERHLEVNIPSITKDAIKDKVLEEQVN